jgi:hypothetical protein
MTGSESGSTSLWISEELLKLGQSLLDRAVMRRQLDEWLAKETLLATMALRSLTASLVLEAHDEIAALDFTGRTFGRAEFLDKRIKTLIWGATDPLVVELVKAANEDLTRIIPTEALQVRISSHVDQPRDLLGSISSVLTGALSVAATADLYGLVRDHVCFTLLAGAKDKPAVLEQLITLYVEAAERVTNS